MLITPTSIFLYISRFLRRGFPNRALATFALGALLTTPVSAQPITVGEGLAVTWAQFFVTDTEKLWEKQGLQPTSIIFPSGRLVLDAVVGGRAHIGTVAGTPVVFAALNGIPVRIIATLHNGAGAPYEPFKLVASQDIKTAADIKGKRIGYSQGTDGHYYLSKLLTSVNLKFSDIQAVSLTPSDFVSSTVNGTLDGFVWGEPHISQALAQSKGRLHAIASPGLYEGLSTVVTLQSTIDQHPALLRSALKAIATADGEIRRDPQKAIQNVASRVNFDLELAKAYWPKLNLGLGLNKAAVVRELENQAKWAIENKLVRPDAKAPDFNKIVVDGFLPSSR